jgi:cold shock CspA family protein
VPGTQLVVNRQSHPNIKVAITNAFEAMERKLDEHGRKQRGQVKQDQRAPRARIVRMFPEGGYGFLQDEEGTERYFHKNSVLPPTTFEELGVGTEVRFTPESGDEGPQASSVALAGR